MSATNVQLMREHLHPLDVGLWLRMIPVTFAAAREFKLPLRGMAPNSTGRRPFSRDGCQEMNGWCQPSTGEITICLRFKSARTGEWMPAARPEAAVWRTLAHELTHLECGQHNARFWTMMQSIEDAVHALRHSNPSLAGWIAAHQRGKVFALGPANQINQESE